MIRITVSNRVEELVDALAADLASSRPPGAVLLPPRIDIVVPSQNVAAYLRFELARRLAVVANFHFHFLVRELRSLVEGDRQAGEPGLRCLGVPEIQHLLLGRLADDSLLRRPVMAPVAAYLAAGAEAGPDAVDRRRFQLAGRLARVFEEYGYHRPEMLAAWSEARAVLGGETELWQRELWCSIFAHGGWRARRDADSAGRERWCTLAELPDLLRAGDPRLRLPPQLFVFGLTYVSPGFLRIFGELGRQERGLRVYTLSACERGDLPRAAAGGAAVADAHPALRLWGRPSLVYLAGLAALDGAEVNQRYRDPGAGSLLRRFQSAILAGRSPPSPPPPATEDTSIRVLACPGLQRELETVAADIWERVAGSREGLRLRFNDVAVVLGVSQLETYQAHVSTIFGEQYGIPHSVVDLPGHSTSRLLELVRQLIELPLGRFTREEMLSVLVHPLVAGGDAQAGGQRSWLEWCEQLGIFQGADRSDYEGTYVEGDLYSWDQGIRRLTLGVFAPDAEESTRFGEFDYLPLPSSASEAISAGRFARLARSLLSDCRHARSSRLTMREWSTYFAALLSSYVGALPAEEEPFLWRCRRCFASLAELDDLEERRASYRTAAEYALASLDSASSARGQYLTHGVVVSSFLPMRPLPFRAIYVLGLGEGRFPASDSADTLDLQGQPARRRVSDVRDSERDRTMFLETVLSARDSLTLSYVARDTQTGEELEPSAVVEELMAIVETDLGAPRASLVVTPPLRRHEAPQVQAALDGRDEPPPSCSGEAYMEARAVALRRHLETTVGGDIAAARLLREHPTLHEVGLPDPVKRALRLGSLEALAPGRETPVAAPVNVTLAAVRKYLECPLQGWASFTLRMGGDSEEDLLFKEDEAFHSSRLLQAILLRGAFMDATADPALAVEDAYDHRAHILELQGRSPTGCFAAAERRRHLRTLRDWLANASQLGVAHPERLELLHYGHAGEDAREPHIVGAIELSLPAASTGDGAEPTAVRIMITGTTEPTDLDSGVSVTLLASEPHGGIRGRFLRGFVDYVAAAMALPEGESLSGHRIVVCPPGDRARREQCVLTLAALEAGRARAWMRDVLRDMLLQSNEVLFPFEAALEWRQAGGKVPAARIVGRLVDKELAGTTTRYGPVRRPERYPPPIDPAALVERRYGLLFDLYSDGPWGLERGEP